METQTNKVELEKRHYSLFKIFKDLKLLSLF